MSEMSEPPASSEQALSLSAYLRGLRMAVVFLTRIPVGRFDHKASDWQWCSANFPVVGAALGGVLASFGVLGLPHLGPWVTSLLIVGAGLILTGAFHEDGLADTADALGGAYDREKIFVILKDSRIGTFGASALVVSLGLRVALLARAAETDLAPFVWMLLLGQSLSRVAPVWLMARMPYVTSKDKSKSRPWPKRPESMW